MRTLPPRGCRIRWLAYPSPMQIERARVLVAGGAHRVGAALALDLAQAGAHVAISYHSRPEQALETVRRIDALGVRSAAIQADAADPASMRALVDEAAEALDGL